MKAEISYSKALLAHAQGRSNDAEQAFSDYLSTNTAKQLESIINGNEYLMLTHRYSEAAKNYELLDKFLKSGGYKANLENIGRFILPKYRANLMAGNKDSALRAASLVAEYYDSALIRQRIIDADLLTAVYDTEGKERQIAEQRAELSHQRLIALIIIMAIFITFVTVYIVQHRKAYKKLNESNRQLVLANERAEESSRMKTKFIQEISHEVRTPLNIISGFSQVMAVKALNQLLDNAIKYTQTGALESVEKARALLSIDIKEHHVGYQLYRRSKICDDIASSKRH